MDQRLAVVALAGKSVLVLKQVVDDRAGPVDDPHQALGFRRQVAGRAKNQLGFFLLPGLAVVQGSDPVLLDRTERIDTLRAASSADLGAGGVLGCVRLYLTIGYTGRVNSSLVTRTSHFKEVDYAAYAGSRSGARRANEWARCHGLETTAWDCAQKD